MKHLGHAYRLHPPITIAAYTYDDEDGDHYVPEYRTKAWLEKLPLTCFQFDEDVTFRSSETFTVTFTTQQA